jgi:hypothetical protein
MSKRSKLDGVICSSPILLVNRSHNPRKPAMIEKHKTFFHSHFPAEVLQRADEKLKGLALKGLAQGENLKFDYYTLGRA